MSRYKPYPQYKDSGVEWLGEVPGHWIHKRLKYYARIKNGQDQKKVLSDDGQYPVYGSGGEFGRADKYLYNKESVLLGRKGTIDKPLFIVEPFWTVDTMYYTVILKTTFPKFFYYACLTIEFDYYQYGSAVPSMTQENLHSIYFANPPYEEQIVIANFLDNATCKIDTLIQKQQNLIALLKEKRQALISHAVTKGLNPHVKMKDSGVEWLGEVPEHWETERLKYLCQITTGNKDTENKEDCGEYPFYVRSQTIERINSYSYDGEAILTAGDGVGVGKVFHYVNGKFDYHQRVYMFYKFSKVKGKYLFEYMKNNLYKIALEGGAKSTVDSLRLPLLQNFMITVPSQEEQEDIIFYLNNATCKIDTLISKAQQAIELLKERRTALISATVTGKIDVRNYFYANYEDGENNHD